MVDWERTQAWGDGGYYARVFLNVQGRGKEGTIAPAECAARARGAARQAGGTGRRERPSHRDARALPRGDLPRVPRHRRPTSIVYFGNLDWRSAGTVGQRRACTSSRTTPDPTTPITRRKVFSCGTAAARAATSKPPVSIYDVAPSILDYFEIPAPPEMIGHSNQVASVITATRAYCFNGGIMKGFTLWFTGLPVVGQIDTGAARGGDCWSAD